MSQQGHALPLSSDGRRPAPFAGALPHGFLRELRRRTPEETAYFLETLRGLVPADAAAAA